MPLYSNSSDNEAELIYKFTVNLYECALARGLTVSPPNCCARDTEDVLWKIANNYAAALAS